MDSNKNNLSSNTILVNIVLLICIKMIIDAIFIMPKVVYQEKSDEFR